MDFASEQFFHLQEHHPAALQRLQLRLPNPMAEAPPALEALGEQLSTEVSNQRTSSFCVWCFWPWTLGQPLSFPSLRMLLAYLSRAALIYCLYQRTRELG